MTTMITEATDTVLSVVSQPTGIDWSVGTYKVRANVNTGCKRIPGLMNPRLMSGGHSMKTFHDVVARSEGEAEVLAHWKHVQDLVFAPAKVDTGWVNAVLQFTPKGGDHHDTIEVARVGREISSAQRCRRW